MTIPFKWYPRARVLTQALLWRLTDLEEADGRPIDLVIATKFPSYAIRHPNKVVWLVHQFRQAYELDGTPLGQFGPGPVRPRHATGGPPSRRRALGEARKLFAISQNVANRLRENNGLEAEVLRPPPQELDYHCDEYGDFVLSVGRLDRAKRVDLLVEGLAAEPEARSRRRRRGAGPLAARGARARAGLDERLRFAGRVDEPSCAACTHGASPSSTRRSTRISASCPTRRFCRRSRW